MRKSAKTLTGSILRCLQTITYSTISRRRSARSYFETKDWGTSSLLANSTWLTWARLRTSLRNNPKFSFSAWKSFRYRTSPSANILSEVILKWVITNGRMNSGSLLGHWSKTRSGHATVF